MPINYGGHLFTDPLPLTNNLLYYGQGIYIMQALDGRWTPRAFRPLYVGECENFQTRLKLAHERFLDCRRTASDALIYVSILPTTGITTVQRRAIETALIQRYDPPCNRQKRPDRLFPRIAQAPSYSLGFRRA